MRKTVLLLLLVIVVFSISLLTIIFYLSGTTHFSILNGLLMPIIGIILSFGVLRKTLWLMAIVPLEKWQLRSCERRIQRNALDMRVYLAKIRILMRLVSYDCERMKYFLSWGTDGVPARDIRPRLDKDLARIDMMLQTLATASMLNKFTASEMDLSILNKFAASEMDLSMLGVKSQFISSMEERLAEKRLKDFERLFPVEIKKTPFDQPVYLLVEALHMLCAAIALNPLYTEAFVSAAGLMEYLQREELAGKCQQAAVSLGFPPLLLRHWGK